jgi:hypothetical protein
MLLLNPPSKSQNGDDEGDGTDCVLMAANAARIDALASHLE